MELTRVVRCWSLTVLSFLLAAPLFADFTGTWSGTYLDAWFCGGNNFTSTGPILLVLTQSGNQVTGTATVDFSAEDCQMLSTPKRVTGPVEGTVSGNTFNGFILGKGSSSAAILTLSNDGAVLDVQYKKSVLPPTQYFLTATLSRQPAGVSAVTGYWNGVVDWTPRCPNNYSGYWSGTGKFTVSLTELAGSATGVATIEGGYPPRSIDCEPFALLSKSMPLSGTLSGSTLSATALFPLIGGDMKFGVFATLSGPTMSVTLSGAQITGAGTLTRTSNVIPDSRFSGAWTGNYIENQGAEGGCPALPGYTGPMSASFFHSGTEISGFMTFLDTKHYDYDTVLRSCGLHEHYDVALFLSGSVSGNTVTGSTVQLRHEGGGQNSDSLSPITFTLSGDMIEANRHSADFSSSEASTLFRSSTTLPPIITSFDAGQPSITAGQSSTLRWDTFNTTSVSIDNGLGSQGTSGSVTITPLLTTTYTLTATVNGGTVTAKTTVAVLKASRRRASRH